MVNCIDPPPTTLGKKSQANWHLMGADHIGNSCTAVNTKRKRSWCYTNVKETQSNKASRDLRMGQHIDKAHVFLLYLIIKEVRRHRGKLKIAVPCFSWPAQFCLRWLPSDSELITRFFVWAFKRRADRERTFLRAREHFNLKRECWSQIRGLKTGIVCCMNTSRAFRATGGESKVEQRKTRTRPDKTYLYAWGLLCVENEIKNTLVLDVQRVQIFPLVAWNRNNNEKPKSTKPATYNNMLVTSFLLIK